MTAVKPPWLLPGQKEKPKQELLPGQVDKTPQGVGSQVAKARKTGTKPKMGAPEHEPNDELRHMVICLAGIMGSSQLKIAEYMGISRDTLVKHYKEQLEHGKMIAELEVASALFRNAVVKNDTIAQIFYLKARAGWKDQELPEPELDEHGRPVGLRPLVLKQRKAK